MAKEKEECDFEFDREKLRKKDKKLAIELMEEHFRFFGVINDLKENEAVLRGAKISCTHGNKTICLDTYKDHGIYDHKTPVMTCSDCKQGQNIYSFGACGNDKFEPVYSKQLPAPKGDITDAQGNARHICLPLLEESWGTGGSKNRIPIFCFNGIQSGDWLWNKKDYTDERKRIALEEYSGMKNKKEYVEILLSQANLLCLYGGIITVEENPEPEEVMIDEAENTGIMTEVPLKEKVQIASWLTAYKGEPEAENGEIIFYDKNERDKLKKVNPYIDWYSYEGQSKKNSNCEKYLEGQEFKSESGVLIDEQGRYWITLGPRVIDPDYPDTGNCQAEYFKDSIGCRVDVVLNRIDNEDEYVYIECVWSGNIKAHTFGNGIFQTGYPYKNSSEAKIHPYSKDYVNGSIVEFTGKNPGDTGIMSKYVVDYLIVYPKEKDE